MTFRNSCKKFVLCFCVTILTLVFVGVCAGNNGEKRFHILMLNDPHSYILPYREASGDEAVEVGGMTKALWLLEEERKKIKAQDSAPIFLIEAGDIMLGMKGAAFAGKPEYSILTRLGFDVGVLGNHDFDAGVSTLAKLGKTLKFPVLASNITFDDKATGACFHDTAIIKRGGVTVGCFGLVTPTLKSVISDPTGFSIEQDVISAAKKYVAELKERNVDVIIAVNHIGLDYDIKLAKEVAGINIIVGGHSHDAIRNKTIVTGPDGSPVIIGQAGLDGRYIGRFDIVVKGGKLDPVKSNWRLLEVELKTPETKWISGVGKTAMDRMSKNLKLGNPVAVFTNTVDVRKEAARTRENAMGDILADAMRSFGGADIGIANGGALRIGRVIPKGEFSPADMLDLLPFADVVELAVATGAEIRKQLEISASSLKGDNDSYDPSVRTSPGEFLQVSGLRVTYNLRRTPALVVNRKMIRPGERVIGVEVNGRPLDDAKTYTVCGSDFTLRTWDKIKVVDLKKTDMSVFDDYIESKYNRVLSPKVDSRITIIR